MLPVRRLLTRYPVSQLTDGLQRDVLFQGKSLIMRCYYVVSTVCLLAIVMCTICDITEHDIKIINL
jgi:hypothetical protein